MIQLNIDNKFLLNNKYSLIFNDYTYIYLLNKENKRIDKYSFNLEFIKSYDFDYTIKNICYDNVKKVFYALENSTETIILIFSQNFKLISKVELNISYISNNIIYDKEKNKMLLLFPDKYYELDNLTYKIVNSYSFNNNSEFPYLPYDEDSYIVYLRSFNITDAKIKTRFIDISFTSNINYFILCKENNQYYIYKIKLTDNNNSFNDLLPNKINTEITLSDIPISNKDTFVKSKELYIDAFDDTNDITDNSRDNNQKVDFSFDYDNNVAKSSFKEKIEDIDNDINFLDNYILSENSRGVANVYSVLDNDTLSNDISYGDIDLIHNFDLQKSKNDIKYSYFRNDNDYEVNNINNNSYINLDNNEVIENNNYEKKGKCLNNCKHNCNLDCSANDIMESIAQIELSIANLLNSEAEKIQKILKCSNSTCIILETNNSVIEVIQGVTKLEETLLHKLKILLEIIKHNHYK